MATKSSRLSWSGAKKQCDGTNWTAGRHTPGGRFEKDCEKYNAAVLADRRVLRFTRDMIGGGAALDLIQVIFILKQSPSFLGWG